MKTIFPLFLIFLISLFVFRSTFNLSFWGDDWLIFWVNKYFHGPPSTGEWSYFSHFFTLYGSQAVLMELLKFLFGMNPFYFYLTSFILRLLAAYSLIPLLIYLTKNRAIAFFSALFFSITFTGLETSEYLPHMTSYIALIFFNLFLYFFIRAREEKNKKLFLISVVLFFFTFMGSPIRMVGLIPLVILLEVFSVLKDNESLRSGVIRVAIIITVFLLINFFGHPLYPVSEPQQKIATLPFSQLSNGINTLSSQLNSGHYLSLFSPLVSFGNSLIPDAVLPDLKLLPSLVIAYLIFLIFSFALTFSILELTLGLAWTLFIAFAYYFNLSQDLPIKYLLPLLLGGYILIIGIFLMIKFSSRRLILDGLIISLAWPFLSFAVAWIYSPVGFIPSSQRYLIGSTVGVAIFIALLVTLSKNKKLLLIVFLILISTHLIATKNYWPSIEKNRNSYLGSKIWSAFPYYPQVGKNKNPDIFYFQGDGNNSSIIHDLITFGFPPHIDLIYNLNYLKGDKIPVPMTEWKDVVEAVQTGKSLSAYSYPLIPVPIDQVYVFRLSSDDNLIDITEEVRKNLVQ